MSWIALAGIAALVGAVVWLNLAARRRPLLTPDEEYDGRQW